MSGLLVAHVKHASNYTILKRGELKHCKMDGMYICVQGVTFL